MSSSESSRQTRDGFSLRWVPRRPREARYSVANTISCGKIIRFARDHLQNHRRPFKRGRSGEMAEWLKAHAWKACVRETVPWVRIPLSPPFQTYKLFKALNNLREHLTEPPNQSPTLEALSLSQGLQEGRRIEADRTRDVQKFQNIQAPIAALVLCNIGRRSAQSAR